MGHSRCHIKSLFVTRKATAFYMPRMGKSVRIPDPVYSKVTREAERQDVSRGVVIRDWMEKAEEFDELEARR